MGKKGPGSRRKPALARAVAPNPEYRQKKYFKGLKRAAHVINWIEGMLTFTQGRHAGQPFLLRSWQKSIIRKIYRTDKDGRRIKSKVLVTIPRKNGKTELAAALAMVHLCGPESEPRGQYYSAAADRQQAAIIFRQMKAMIQYNQILMDRTNVKDFTKEIEDLENGSVYTALSSDANTKHGINSPFIVYDELAQAPNRTLYDVLDTSQSAWEEPLFVIISTQSSDPHHIMTELTDYAIQVRDGIIQDDTFLPVVYMAPDDCDLWNEQVWYDCNPALGDFRSLKELQDKAKMAQRLPSHEGAFRNLYLNQRTDAESRFIPQGEWMECLTEYTEKDLYGQKCYGGLDLGSTRDLTCLALFFPDTGHTLIYSWCPGESLKTREDTDKVPYRQWNEAGWIEKTNARGTDKKHIANRLGQLKQLFDIQSIGFDRWKMDDLKKWLDEVGVDLPLTECGQGYKDMSPAVNAFEERIINRTLKHNGNPVLTWAISNCVISKDAAENRKLDKEKARERIDPAVACVMAVGVARKAPAPVEYDFSVSRVLSAG